MLAGNSFRGAILAKPGNIGSWHCLGTPFGELQQACLVRHRRLVRTAHSNRLELLGAHHGAKARAAVGAVGHAHDGCVAHKVLARRADLQHLHAFVVQLSMQCVFHIAGDAAPQMRCVAQLKLAILNPQINRARRLPAQHNSVKAGKLQLGRKKAATLRVANAAGKR